MAHVVDISPPFINVLKEISIGWSYLHQWFDAGVNKTEFQSIETRSDYQSFRVIFDFPFVQYLLQWCD